jgi:molecular chaperone HtpG
VVLRELLQNGIDAVRLQQLISAGEYEPTVRVAWNPDDRILTVTDNGTGMTQEVIEAFRVTDRGTE